MTYRDLPVYVNRFSQGRLTTLLNHYEQNGLVPREKSGKRKNNLGAYTYEYDDISNTVKFIIEYTQIHGLLLPGQVRGFKKEDVKLLPSSETKAKVHKAYIKAMQSLGMHTI